MHDYHMHSHFCRHATGSLEEYARAAVARGITEICFTPHLPLPGFRPGFFNDRLRMAGEDFPRYLDELERTRTLVPGLTILSGVEADYIEGKEEYIERFLSAHAFDFVLMSVHFIRDWPEDQFVFDYEGDPRPLERIYDDYLAAVRKGVETGLYDSVAHFDLIKKPGAPLLATHRAEVEEIIGSCVTRGMSAEINTSGVRKEIGETYPSPAIVALMARRGLPLTPGSDAHAPSQVGLGLAAMNGRKMARYRARRITVDA
jgi:histidinol-phosphatase (PHP family)